MADRSTGVASYFNWNGVAIPIRKYTRKSERKLAVFTDNADYNPGTGIIQPVTSPVMVSTTITAEGTYRFSTTPSLDSVLYSGATQIPVQLGRNAGNLCGHGTFDISDYTEDGPFDDTITWTATFTSNGPFTPDA